MDNKTIAICTECNSKYYVGEDCIRCNDGFHVGMAKYAKAMKAALACWSDAGCEDHKTPCQPTIKEFATTLLALQDRINSLETGILKHKEKNISIDNNDKELYVLIYEKAPIV